MKELRFKPIEDKDIPLVEQWLYQDYILQWYHEPEEWIREMHQRNGEFSFLNHYIVYDGDTPFAFCQYYDIFYAPEEWYMTDSVGHTYSIDYLIGDKNYLSKGYGKRIVASLIEKIRSHQSAKLVVVQPEEENIASCKSLLTNGFGYSETNQYYYLELQ